MNYRFFTTGKYDQQLNIFKFSGKNIRNIMYKEKYLVEVLKERLDPIFEKIWIHKKPSASKKFRDLTRDEFGIIPILQPEFDMIFKTHDGQLNAIEAKRLNKSVKGYNMPYYRGIDQAIALQRFGFDHCGLWMFVSNDIKDEDMHKYGGAAWHFIRNEINLQIEYSYFKVLNNDSIPDFKVMQYKDQFSGYNLLNIDDPNFRITWKYENPIRFNEASIKMRRLIEIYLNEKC